VSEEPGAALVDQAVVDPALVDRAVALVAGGRRALLGLAGPPGAGKSTLAAGLVAALGARGFGAGVLPMDGFHLAQAELERLGRADRKGAPDTFDAAGFVALLGRVRAAGERVYAPRFDRALEEPIAGAIAVEPAASLVVVEGNYLLHDDGAWAHVAALLDACWYLDLPDEVRVARLVARHVAHGRSPQAARDWVLRSDEANARLVARGRGLAALVVPVD